MNDTPRQNQQGMQRGSVSPGQYSNPLREGNAQGSVEKAEQPKAEQPKPDEPLVKVELVRNYVPRDLKPGPSGAYDKSKPGDVIDVSKDEAKFLLDRGIAKISSRTL